MLDGQMDYEARRQALEFAVKHVPYDDKSSMTVVAYASAFYEFLEGKQTSEQSSD
ncbi:MAG TPA: hypothetical protein VLJ17_24615 [Xanthobacteraceae bacterium]|nr:hypothetical protein [Xanthobacteraceae bacterium]